MQNFLADNWPFFVLTFAFFIVPCAKFLRRTGRSEWWLMLCVVLGAPLVAGWVWVLLSLLQLETLAGLHGLLAMAAFVVLPMVPAGIAHKKGHGFVPWYLGSFFLGAASPFAILYAIALEPRPKGIITPSPDGIGPVILTPSTEPRMKEYITETTGGRGPIPNATRRG